MSKAVIAIHGGAGAITRAQLSPEQEKRYIDALNAIVETGQRMLEAGDSALDVVTEAVRLLEECPLFNAGIGSVFTRDETHELDACVMDGVTLKAGAVAGVSRLRNPVLAARLVMEQSPHVLLAGAGAEKFAVEHGMDTVSPELFSTEERYRQLLEARTAGMTQLDHAAPLDERSKMGTVGAVALDKAGNPPPRRRQAASPTNFPVASATARCRGPGVTPITPPRRCHAPAPAKCLSARWRPTTLPH